MRNPLHAALYLVLFLCSLWIGSIWNSRAQSQDLPAPSEGLPAEIQDQNANPQSQPQPGLAQDPLTPPIEEVPHLSTMNQEGWVYDPTGRRDPFRPFGNKSAVTVANGDLLDPLQRFNLEELKILGILWDVSRPRALVRDPNKNVHTVFVGTKMGSRHGMVVAIRESEVLVQESVDEDGVLKKAIKILGTYGKQQ